MGVGKRDLAGLSVVGAGAGLLAVAVLAPRQWLTDPSRDAGRALAMTAAALLVVAGIPDRVAQWWAVRWRRAALRGRWPRLLALGELLARPAVATALFALAALTWQLPPDWPLPPSPAGRTAGLLVLFAVGLHFWSAMLSVRRRRLALRLAVRVVLLLGMTLWLGAANLLTLFVVAKPPAAPPYGVMGQLPAMVDDVAFGLVAAALVVVVIRWLDAEWHRDDGSPSAWPAPARGARRRSAS